MSSTNFFVLYESDGAQDTCSGCSSNLQRHSVPDKPVNLGFGKERGLLCDNWQSNPVSRIADFPIKLNTERCLKTSICELETNRTSLEWKIMFMVTYDCFSTAGPRPGTGPWHQLYRAVRDSPGIDN